MIYPLLILYTAITSRMSGGGLGAKYLPRWLTWLPELLFASAFGYALFSVFGNYYASAVATAWSYTWMQTGHGTVLHWGKHPEHATGERTQTLTPVVNWLAARIGLTIGEVGYCRLFMAVKGFLIGLPVGGIPLAILWPLGYEIGKRHDNHALAELASGAGAGIAICIFLAVV